MRLFAVERRRQHRLLQHRRHGDVLRDEVHDALTLQIELAVLLAAAEDCLAALRAEGKAIAPAWLAAQTGDKAARPFDEVALEPVPAAREDDAVPVDRKGRERDVLEDFFRSFGVAVTEPIGLFLSDRRCKGLRSAVADELTAVVYDCQIAAARAD